MSDLNRFTGVKMYTASWCGPCKSAKPWMKKLEEQGVKVQYLDGDTEEIQKEMTKKRISGMPTFLLVRAGRCVRRFVGWPQETKNWPMYLAKKKRKVSNG